MTEEQRKVRYQKEFDGPAWKHPYMIYIGLTVVLFGALVFVGWLAWTNGWVPSRGAVR